MTAFEEEGGVGGEAERGDSSIVSTGNEMQRVATKMYAMGLDGDMYVVR